MAEKYHIKDDGMPGKCGAASADSCPKTAAGDGFHGTLEEASKEAEQRFESKLGAFVTASKVDEQKKAAGEAFAAKFATAAQKVIDNPGDTASELELQKVRDELNAELRAGRGSAIVDSSTYENAEIALAQSQAKPAGEVYVHPQGKIIRVDADGTVRAYKDGKEVGTSATADKLRAGYGSWKLDGNAVAPVAPAAPAKLSPEDQEKMVDSYDSKVSAVKDAMAAEQAVHAAKRAYDSQNGAAEGRAYYIGAGGSRVPGVNPNGNTYFRESPEQEASRKAARQAVVDAQEAEDRAQTELEKADLGHRIPDEGHTIRVRTQAQKWLLKDELQGQISDGHWENSSNNPWEDWSNAKVVVDPQNPGRNFRTAKDNYQLNASSLLDVVGDRMVENVQTKTENSSYDEKAMQRDLKDLRTIFKTQRGQVTGD